MDERERADGRRHLTRAAVSTQMLPPEPRCRGGRASQRSYIEDKETGGWPVGHIFCVLAGIVALVILVTVVVTWVHHGGYYDRSPWGSG